MKISSKFTVAVHTLLVIELLGKEYKTTSEFIASSVNVNPVVIRRALQDLKRAGIVSVAAGSGGAKIIKDLKDITLYDVYAAVDCADSELFHFHENPNPQCPVGKNIHKVLDGRLSDAQQALENSLKNVTLSSLAESCADLIN